MALTDHFAKPGPCVVEQQEVLYQIEKTRRLASGPQHRFKCHAFETVLLNAFPRHEVVERFMACSHQGSETIRQNGKTVEIEQAGDGVAVIAQIGLISFLN